MVPPLVTFTLFRSRRLRGAQSLVPPTARSAPLCCLRVRRGVGWVAPPARGRLHVPGPSRDFPLAAPPVIVVVSLFNETFLVRQILTFFLLKPSLPKQSGSCGSRQYLSESNGGICILCNPAGRACKEAGCCCPGSKKMNDMCIGISCREGDKNCTKCEKDINCLSECCTTPEKVKSEERPRPRINN